MKTLSNSFNSISKKWEKNVNTGLKGDIAVVMFMHKCWEMFMRNLSNREYYTCKRDYDPTEVLNKLIADFAMKHKEYGP